MCSRLANYQCFVCGALGNDAIELDMNKDKSQEDRYRQRLYMYSHCHALQSLDKNLQEQTYGEK